MGNSKAATPPVRANSIDMRVAVALIVLNLAFSAGFMSFIFTSGKIVAEVDFIDIFFEGSSAFLALFMFCVVCFIRIPPYIRWTLLSGLFFDQIGRTTDSLDEIVYFDTSHWSALGDGVTLLGEFLVVIAATAWLLRAYKLSVTDELTQLFNRHYLESIFEKNVYYGRNLRQKSGIALIMLDVDNFKRINDCFGHGVGDDVLREMANILRQKTRRTDVVARQGGEEFEILLVQTDLDEAVFIAERVRKAFEDFASPELPSFTASIGVAEYITGEDMKSIRRRADTAVYQAKREGKNRVVIADRESRSSELVAKILKSKAEAMAE